MIEVLRLAQTSGGYINRLMYPAGQMRLIVQGLYNRELIDECPRGGFQLTQAGWDVELPVREAR
jgi:hypothetical protein